MISEFVPQVDLFRYEAARFIHRMAHHEERVLNEESSLASWMPINLVPLHCRFQRSRRHMLLNRWARRRPANPPPALWDLLLHAPPPQMHKVGAPLIPHRQTSTMWDKLMSHVDRRTPSPFLQSSLVVFLC